MLNKMIRALSWGSTKLPPEVSNVIEAARIIWRGQDDDEGQRLVVMLAGPLRGAFVYSEEEAKRRIEARWPWLNAGQLRAACNFLEARVRVDAAERKPRNKKNWIFNY